MGFQCQRALSSPGNPPPSPIGGGSGTNTKSHQIWTLFLRHWFARTAHIGDIKQISKKFRIWYLPFCWSNRVRSQVLILLPERLVAKHCIYNYQQFPHTGGGRCNGPNARYALQNIVLATPNRAALDHFTDIGFDFIKTFFQPSEMILDVFFITFVRKLYKSPIGHNAKAQLNWCYIFLSTPVING